MSGSVPSRPSPGRVRLTRRGRIVLLVLGLLVAVLLAALAAPASMASDPPEPEPVGSTVAVVLPGDTLWSVAARHVPSRDPYGMIEEIRRLNDLSGNTIHPGQRLQLPAG